MRFIFVLVFFSFSLMVLCAKEEDFKREIPPSQSLIKRLKNSNYTVVEKIKVLNAFEKLGFHLQPQELIEIIEYLTALEYAGKDKNFADKIFIFSITSLNNIKEKITEKEEKYLTRILFDQLDLCARKDPEWFDKFAQLHYSSTPGSYLNKEKKLLSHYIVDLDSETLLSYYLKQKKYALFGNLLGIFTQCPDAKVYSYFHEKLFLSDNETLRALLVKLYFEYNSLLYAMSTDQIEQFLYFLSQSKSIPDEKKKTTFSNLFHVKLQSNLYEIPIDVKQKGIWQYLLFIAHNHKDIDVEILLEHLVYQILLGHKSASIDRVKEYEKLAIYNANNSKWNSKFFFWYIGIGIFTFDPQIAERVLDIATSKMSSFKIENYGNLWLLCYAVSSYHNKISEKSMEKYIFRIKQELDKRVALKLKKESYILLSNSYKFLGYKRRAAEVLLVALQQNVSKNSNDINMALEELQTITGHKCGINFAAWQKAIDAMPEEKELSIENPPPVDVSP